MGSDRYKLSHRRAAVHYCPSSSLLNALSKVCKLIYDLLLGMLQWKMTMGSMFHVPGTEDFPHDSGVEIGGWARFTFHHL